tara:strand:+ start:1837 stop:2778 length:942 start_codon:yes stop_codon:yes gene_type:complete
VITCSSAGFLYIQLLFKEFFIRVLPIDEKTFKTMPILKTKMLQEIKKARVQSPSSINTFKQCRRKYFYNYIEKLPQVSNIHQVRGNIAHSVLEDFFDMSITDWTIENYQQKIKVEVQQLLVRFWGEYNGKLNGLGLNPDKERFYFEETMLMLLNWSNHFIEDMEKTGLPINEAFECLTPIRELQYKSEALGVRGFVDAIHHVGNEIHIIDYKTNSKFSFSNSIRLQLGIYSLLYKETHGIMPDRVGIFFLRQKMKTIAVDEGLLEEVKLEIMDVHKNTQSIEIEDYPRTVTGLCKWSTGQCDFYKTCKPHDNR